MVVGHLTEFLDVDVQQVAGLVVFLAADRLTRRAVEVRQPVRPSEARASVDERLFRTRRLVGVIGEWHTHPHHLALPSLIDERAMTEMADTNGAPVLLMIFGSDDSDGWARWLGGGAPPPWHAGLYFPA